MPSSGGEFVTRQEFVTAMGAVGLLILAAILVAALMYGGR